MQLIEIDPEYGLVYTEDFSGIRAMLKHEPSLVELVDTIERDALGLVADPADKEGNRQIRENADWVKKCARRLEKIRTEAVADLKREPKIIEDSVRPHLKRLEALAVQILAPVVEMDARADRLRIIADRPNILSAAPIAQLEQELATAQAMGTDEAEWKERTKEAELVKISLVEALEALLAKRKQDEADRLELERLRQEKAEKEMRERIERETRERLEREQREKAEREAADEARAKRAAAEAVVAEEAVKNQPVPSATIPDATPAPQTRQRMTDAELIRQRKEDGDRYEDEAYADLQAAFRAASYRDPIRYVLDEIKRGNIRHITANI